MLPTKERVSDHFVTEVATAADTLNLGLLIDFKDLKGMICFHAIINPKNPVFVVAYFFRDTEGRLEFATCNRTNLEELELDKTNWIPFYENFSVEENFLEALALTEKMVIH